MNGLRRTLRGLGLAMIVMTGCRPGMNIEEELVAPERAPVSPEHVQLFPSDANFPTGFNAKPPKAFKRVADLTITWSRKPPKDSLEVKRAMALAGAQVGADAVYLKRQYFMILPVKGRQYVYSVGAVIWR